MDAPSAVNPNILINPWRILSIRLRLHPAKPCRYLGLRGTGPLRKRGNRAFQNGHMTDLKIQLARKLKVTAATCALATTCDLRLT
jgi:hypothetical protein